MSRAHAREQAGLAVLLPPPTGAEHLIDYLWDAGPGVDGGMGTVPLGWADLQAWQAQTGIELSAWEVRTLRQLSRQYLFEAEAAKKADRPAPWLAEPTQQDRAHIARHVRSLLRG